MRVDNNQLKLRAMRALRLIVITRHLRIEASVLSNFR